MPQFSFLLPLSISLKLEVMSTDDTWIKVVVDRGGDAMGTSTSTNRGKLVNVQEQHPYGLALYVPIQCVSKLFPNPLSKDHFIKNTYFILMFSLFSTVNPSKSKEKFNSEFPPKS